MTRFARRMDAMRPSTIREILKAAVDPEIISFAGGLPAPELFPVDDVRAACDRVLAEDGSKALQYATTEGYQPLREILCLETRQRGITCSSEDILVTTGSQQALDLVAKAFIDPGDFVLTENPTYLAALQTFQSYEARFAPVPTDDRGIRVEAIRELAARYQPKLLYLIPNFQNPTGRTLEGSRRKALYEAAAESGIVVIEDDPYGKLRYAGTDLPPVKSHDVDGRVIYVSTVSKTVAPGLRVGWVVSREDIRNRLVIGKQAADLHSSILDQRILHRYLSDYDNAAHVEKIRQAYGERYALMDESLRALMPEGFSWTHPEGGMFLWVTCPEGIDTTALLERALKKKIIFVPGRDFFPDGSGTGYMRLNFSNATPERIREGIVRLASLCRSALNRAA